MIKISIVGAGKISENYIKVIKAFKNLKLVGIISRSKESSKKKAKYHKIPYYGNSLKSLMIDTKPDIVIVCVSPNNTKDICLKLLKYKCIVLVEKPLGLSSEDSKEILTKSIKSKSKIFVALNRRFFQSTKTLKKKISKNNHKRVVVINDQEDTLAAKKNGHSKKVIDNWMYANSIHLIDYFTFLCRGKIINVFTKKINLNKKEYFKFAKIEFSSGDIGFYNAFWNRPAPWTISVSTNKSYYYMSPIEKLFEKNYKGELIEHKESQNDKIYKPGFYLMVKNLISVYNKKKNELVSLDKNLDTMMLIKKIYK